MERVAAATNALIGDLDAVINLVAFLQATQDGNGVLHGRLIDHNRLETTFQCRILLDVLAVFVQRCRTDAVQLATCQHRLQQVACIHRAFGLAGANDRMQLIDEKDNLAFALA